MKNRMIIGIFLMLLMLIRIPAALGESFENPVYSQEYIAQQEGMLSQKEQYFPRFMFQENYNGDPTKPQISKPEGGYYKYEMVRGGKFEIMLAAYTSAPADQGWGETHFNTTGSYEDFYMAIEMQLIERDDSGTGYLWFQYTDGNIVGDNARSAVTIQYPLNIVSYVTGPEGRVYTTRYDLSAYKNDYQVHKVEIMRLDGYVRFYIDGHFVTGFDDGFSGRFYQLYGTGLNRGGKYVTGSFDNFILRVR